jgi:putative hemolysin
VRRDQSLQEIERVILTSGHTRLPVVDGDAAVGLLNTKEFLALRAAGSDQWSSVVRPVLQVTRGDPLLGTLRRMQSQRSHLAVVVAEDRPVGIVTMEDILEEVIGEVYDEDDDGFARRLLESRSIFRSIRSRRHR